MKDLKDLDLVPWKNFLKFRLTMIKWNFYQRIHSWAKAKVFYNKWIELRVEYNRYYNFKRVVLINKKTQIELLNKMI